MKFRQIQPSRPQQKLWPNTTGVGLSQNLVEFH